MHAATYAKANANGAEAGAILAMTDAGQTKRPWPQLVS